MSSSTQKEMAAQFRQLHHESLPLILSNAWDAASARIFELAGFRAIATTSSGVAASLGYCDGQQISRAMMVEAIARIVQAVECPVTADIEAGYGSSIDEVVQTVKEVIAAGAVGINIEDSLKQGEKGLADVADQVELITALRELATTVDVPFVINARVDVFLLAIGEKEQRFEHAVQRARAYLQAGADCVYPIGLLPSNVIADLVQAIDGPINIMGGPPAQTIPELKQLGVARVSLAGGLMRSALGHLYAVARELLEQGTYTSMNTELSSAAFRSLFDRK
jgi:2-methylisocitrate lyase-like PEP mutase family enzyme